MTNQKPTDSFFRCFVRLALLLLLVPAPGWSQSRLNQFHGVDNLQSKELIKGVIKDHQGYVWMATDDGALRYDGYQTRLVYRGLPSPFTKAFLKRADSSFFVLSDLGLTEIFSDNDSLFVGPFNAGDEPIDTPLEFPKSVYEDKTGTVWIGESNNVVRINGDGFKRFALGPDYNSVDYHRSFAFAEDAFGHVWVAPFKGSLLRYHRERDTLEAVSLPVPMWHARALACLKGDHLLVGTTDGLLVIKTDSNQGILDATMDGRIREISSIEVLDEENIYLGTRSRGVYHYNFNRPEAGFLRLSQVPIADVVDLYLDRQNEELWIAGSEQVGLLKRSKVSVVQPVGQNRIESFGLYGQSGLFYSVGEHLFHLPDIFSGTPQPLLSLPDNYITRILVDHDRLWMGDAFGGVYALALDEATPTKFIHETDANPISFVTSDRAGNKWCSGHSKGVIRIDSTDQVKFYPEVTGSVVVREAPDGTLYCGAQGRDRLLYRYDQGKDRWAPLPLAYAFASSGENAVFDLGIDSAGTIWLGTDAGLLKVAVNRGGQGPAEVQQVAIDGLDMDVPIRAIAVSGQTLYFAHAEGLVIFEDGDFICINKQLGLPSKILKERGLLLDDEGNLMVATAKGLAVIRKADMQFGRTTKPVVKKLLVNGRRSASASGRLSLPYKTRVETEFISLSYPGNSVLYQTRLAGLDGQWSAPSASRTFDVIAMPDGRYTLEVRAREEGKLWSDPMLLEMTVSPPWYRTWWAILGMTILGVGAVTGANKYHHINLIRQKKNLQKLVEARSREINRQKNELIEQQKHLIRQKEELLAKNEAVYKSQQALIEADVNFLHLKEKQLQEQIEHKNKQITTHALHILQKNETLRHLKKQLEEIVRNSPKVSVPEIRRTLKIIDESFKLDKDWEDFKLYFEQIHAGFYARLKSRYPDLTPLELRHCALIRLNLTLSECASIMGISHDSIKVSRTRLRKKLNIETSQNLSEFILNV